jgi:hypothetical protein
MGKRARILSLAMTPYAIAYLLMAVGAALENPIMAAVVFLGIPIVITLAILYQLRKRRNESSDDGDDDTDDGEDDWTLPRRSDLLLAAYLVGMVVAVALITDAKATAGNVLFAAGAMLLVANLLFIAPWIQRVLVRRYG